MSLKKFFYIFCVVLIYVLSNTLVLKGQSLILQGTVVDFKTKAPIPFVHVTINQGTLGTLSDIDGRFELLVDIPIQKIVFSCVGYDAFIYEVKDPEDLKPLSQKLNIKLFENNTKLDEITISAGENPAHRIIRAAVKNRRKNQTDHLKSYTYRSYQKFYININNQEAETDSIIATAADSAELSMQTHLETHHLFLSESITDYQHKSPWLDQKTVVANRVSGFKKPGFLALAAGIEPFDFYKDYIKILDKAYLNPISPGSTEHYFFSIEDTVLVRPDTVYVISFVPYPDKNFLGLQGYLSIHTKGYALQSVQMSSLDPNELISIKAEQKYDWIDGKQWFPTQTHATFTFNSLTIMDKPSVGVFRSYAKDIQIEPTLRQRDFDPTATILVAPDAHQKSSEFWDSQRLEGLGSQELNTYTYLDSLGEKNNLDFFMSASTAISLNRLPIKWLDLDLGQLLRLNRYEGVRIGAGFHTNPQFNEHLSLGAYVAYGFRDKRVKFGTSANFQIWKRWNLQAGAKYQDDVFEPGNLQFWEEKALLSANSLRYFVTERMDKTQRGEIYLQGQPYRFVQIKAGLSAFRARPGYAYAFLDTENDLRYASFNFSEFSLKARFVFGESYAQVGKRRFLVDAQYPMLYFNFIRGMQILGGDFEYQKYEAKLSHRFRLRGLGESRLTLLGGLLSNGNVPYPILFNGRGIGRNVPITTPEYFQTMDIYEFTSDRFINFFWTHNFGQLLYKSNHPVFQPELVIAHSMGWGSLSASAESHPGIDIKTLERGYFESGLLLNNLLKFKYMDTAYWGLGAGVYLRYGAYRRDKLSDNTFFRITSNFSF